mgnify:CR=1 FL=1
MKHVSIVQNTQSEWLGHIEDHLEGRGIRFGYHRPFADGGRLPDIMTIGDGLMLVGGGAWGSATNGRLLPSLDGLATDIWVRGHNFVASVDRLLAALDEADTLAVAEFVEAHYRDAGISTNQTLVWETQAFDEIVNWYNQWSETIMLSRLPTRAETPAYWDNWSRVLTASRWRWQDFFSDPEEAYRLAGFNQFLLFIGNSVIASGKIMSAPASTHAQARSIAACSSTCTVSAGST